MDRSRAGSKEATNRGRRAPCGSCARRRAGSLILLVCASCVDLLDIPEHPRLLEAPAEPPLTEPSDTAASEAGAPASAAAGLEPARDGAPEALTQPGLAQPLSESRGAETPAQLEPLDAGLPVPDAALTADAAPTLLPCAVPQSLGPNGDCFATVATLLDWADARQACRALGSGWDLASIRSATGNTFVASLLEAEAWIGAADQTREGTWRWVSDGSVFWRGLADAGNSANDAYSNWSSSEPNDNRNSDCARIVPEQNGVWADLECSELRAAVCEGPAR
jgi:hypothetical protein